MATSTAHQESGKYDFRFSSDKFLPFEGAGADETSWTLSISGANGCDIEDIIIYISYTARKG